VVISVGHYIQRKGILDFIELARRMPSVRFFWFGYTDPSLIPGTVRNAIAAAPDNLQFPGYVDRRALRDAYCGADAFAFLSQEETEGIVVLEALACGIPVVLRDIPVYEGWLVNGRHVYKVPDAACAETTISKLLDGQLPDLTAAGRAAAEARSLSRVGAALRDIYRTDGLLAAAGRRPMPERSLTQM
jgi:1,2-diacylglycerol-3-alpha-glucose alpha-1,2-glucosyltransferase